MNIQSDQKHLNKQKSIVNPFFSTVVNKIFTIILCSLFGLFDEEDDARGVGSYVTFHNVQSNSNIYILPSSQMEI